MNKKLLLITALLTGCASLPPQKEYPIPTYNLVNDTSLPIGTINLYRNTGEENCIVIVTVDDSTVGNMLQNKAIGYNINYGEYVLGASFRGDFCGTKDSFITVTIDSAKPYNYEVTMLGDELRLLTRPIDRK